MRDFDEAAQFETEVEEKSSALVVFEVGTLVAFNDGILDAVGKVEAEARALVAGADVSTAEGREVIRSTAYKVARSKTALDELGKALTDEQKRTAAAVDKSRREMRLKLDDLKDEIRKPLTEYEQAEAARVAGHEEALREINDLVAFSGFESVNDLKFRLAKLQGLPTRDWQEFKMRAQQMLTYVERQLMLALAEAQRAEHEAAKKAEADRLAAEAAQRERDERIAREAAEKAKRDAEEEAAERERLAAQRHAREEEEHAERVRLANERADLAERLAAEAVKREQDRVAEVARLERLDRERRGRDDAKRAENKKHRAAINREARAAIMPLLGAAVGTQEQIAELIVAAIARGEIPHVSISY